MSDQSKRNLRLRPSAAFWSPLIIGMTAAILVSSFSESFSLAILIAAGTALVLSCFPETALAMFLIIGVFKNEPTLAWLTKRLDLTIYLAAIVWVLIAYRLFKREERLSGNNAFLLPALLLICLMFVKLIDPVNFAFAIDKAGRFIFLTFLAFLAPVFVLTNKERFERLAKTLVLVGLIVTVNVIIAWLVNPGDLIRIMGTLYIALGRVIGIGAIFAGYLLVSSRSRLWKSLSLLLIPLGAWAIFSSGGRGPAIALILSPIIAGFIATIFQGFRQTAKFLLPGIAVLLIAIALFYFNLLPSVLQQRMASALNPISTGTPADHSFAFRFTLFSFAWQMIKQSPFLGVGFGAFSVATGPALFLLTRLYPHNIFLELGSELGLLGLTLFIVLLISASKKLVSIFSTTANPSVRAAAVTGLVLLAYALLNASISGDINDNKLLWFTMGLPYALAVWPTMLLKSSGNGLDDQV